MCTNRERGAMSRLTGEEKIIFDKVVKFVEQNITLIPLTPSQREKLRKIRAGKTGELKELVEYDSHTLLVAAQYIWHERLSYTFEVMSFNGTNHKFNFFCKVLIDNLPLVWKKIQLQKEKQANADAKIEANELPNFDNPYLKGNNEIKSEVLEALW